MQGERLLTRKVTTFSTIYNIYIYLDMNFSTATNFPPSFTRVLTHMASRCSRHQPHLPMQHWLLQVSFLRRQGIQGTMFNGSNSILLTCVCVVHSSWFSILKQNLEVALSVHAQCHEKPQSDCSSLGLKTPNH